MTAHPYGRLMEEGGEAIVVTLDLAEPVEIRDFVSAFAGLGAQFERYIRERRPDLEDTVKIYVKEVRKGSIEAELVPLVYNTIITSMDHIQIATGFVKTLNAKIRTILGPEHGLPHASKSELTSVVDTLAAVANDPNGRATIKSVRYRSTGRTTEFEAEFDTLEAREAIQIIDAQYRELSQPADEDLEDQLLTFYQSNRRDAEKTGEKGVIESITPKPLAVIYASELARERIKSIMLSGDRNIYKLGFIVDVNVLTRGGNPAVYRIKAVKDVVELPDE